MQPQIDAIAFAVALADLRASDGELTNGDLDDVVAEVVDVFSTQGDATISSIAIRKLLEQRYVVSYEDHDIVIADNSRAGWHDSSHKRGWKHWWRYHDMLLPDRSPIVLKAMDETTDRIMAVLGDPTSTEDFSTTGIVYGDIQSGKTANMIALMAKAAAAGYRFIVILAGMEEDLRTQTQLRVDAGLVGASFRKNGDGILQPTFLGVGKNSRFTYATPLTSVESDLDKKAVAPATTGGPIVLVIKKNPNILRNLLQLIRSSYGLAKGTMSLIDDSIIIVDDECDWGSLDVSRKFDEDVETNPSTINGLIRVVLSTFRRSAYVGYTGTPFANFLISKREHSEYGKDLFPEDFAVILPSPSNYLGVARLLGSRGSRLVDAEERVNHQGLPELIRIVSDNEWVKPGHKISHVPSDSLPASLREAIDRFIVNCALRKNDHNSMLVNLTRFQTVQDYIKNRIETHLAETVNALLCDDQAVWQRLHDLFELRMRPISEQLAAREPGETPISEPWGTVRSMIVEVADTISVKAIHGTSQEVLRYMTGEPVRVIAVGGQKLSRGLTLEGLTISYFDRPANNYDTALQMGRWFGYRDGYLSLCRLYIDEGTLDSYKKISDVCETLREDLSLYDGEASEIGLTFQKVSDMHVTDRAKRQNAVIINTNFAGRMPEAKIFHTDLETRRSNILAASNLLTMCGDPTDIASIKAGLKGKFASMAQGAKLFMDVDRRHILRFLAEYTTHPSADVVRSDNLADFILNGGTLGPNAFPRWNVAFMSGPGDGATVCVLPNGMSFTPRLRSPDANYIKTNDEIDNTRYKDARGRYVIKRIVTETDESIDVDATLAADLTLTLGGKASGSGKARTDWIALRRARERIGRNGLLLLYPIVPEIVPIGQQPRRTDWTDRDVPFMGFALSIPGRRDDATQVMSRETAMKRNLMHAD